MDEESLASFVSFQSKNVIKLNGYTNPEKVLMLQNMCNEFDMPKTDEYHGENTVKDWFSDVRLWKSKFIEMNKKTSTRYCRYRINIRVYLDKHFRSVTDKKTREELRALAKNTITSLISYHRLDSEEQDQQESQGLTHQDIAQLGL